MDQEFDQGDALLEAVLDQQADWAEVEHVVADVGEPEWLTALNMSLQNPGNAELEDAAWTAWLAHRNSPGYRSPP